MSNMLKFAEHCKMNGNKDKLQHILDGGSKKTKKYQDEWELSEEQITEGLQIAILAIENDMSVEQAVILNQVLIF